ncbi:14819_t:CDS:1 [Acaulospora morrowiae]|uniref:14819_t:CDS:1 n=1 Tax=Acaulospora morrowiae TaxID=94023 RepID=A0A9N8ZNG3_9GLOM|nr:14819_t:CDS:1 [Acaulospora morrowiae]
MDFHSRVKNVVESNALRTILFNQVPNNNVDIAAIRRKGKWSRHDIRFTGYHAFVAIVCREAGIILNETDYNVLSNASEMLWKDAPRQNYINIARAVNANIRR